MTSNERDIATDNRDERVLILAPTGRDAEITARVLAEAGLKPEVCKSAFEINPKMLENAGLIFLTGEALTPETMPDLIAALAAQPQWSDIPLVVLTSGGDVIPANAETLEMLSKAGNVTLIERPVRLMTLISAIKSALRARRRQYDIRDYIEGEKRTAGELEKLYKSERNARAEAEAANRLKDEFLATVSHELRTPLNAMLGWTTLLRTGNLDNNKIPQALEIVERNARSQAQIIEDLLDVSRIITGKLSLDVRPHIAAALVKSAVESILPAAAAKNVNIETNISVEAAEIAGDSARVQQVLWNLLSNAVKFTPSGGTIRVSVESKNSNLVISVADTGSGIAPEFLPYVFDRFRQADGTTTRQFGGLGLGLAIVRYLVEQHGGTVEAESEGCGKGATFTIKLPLLSHFQTNGKPLKRVTTDEEDFAPEGKNLLAGLTVMVVDDEIDSLDLVKIFLEASGARVFTAQSVGEALENIKQSAPDVIISDIGMPGVNGYQFIESVRRLVPEKGGNIPAIALTAYARREDREAALLHGFQSHIAKPVEMNKLITTVANLVAHV
ncbi:MAG: ATP-binding protein [Acidobacteriota bacterium]|nr:ATP-binding protein [Acidobacteriota bacterium]